ncbi:hypothetical protein EON64_17585 [archaeon]|nr:MAG: hypothetical protein EON64_17585 [archaeon]
MDLDKAHALPKYSSAMEGLEKELWEKANSTEFIRHLEDTQSMRFILVNQKLRTARPRITALKSAPRCRRG